MSDNEYNKEACEIKHKNIDYNINKNINKIKYNEDEIKRNKEKRYEDMKELIIQIEKEIKTGYVNLNNKIILSQKIIGRKIDELNKFDKKLKGNSHPGIWESVRSLQRNIKIILLILILAIGGEISGISIKSFFPKNKKIEQIKEIDKKYEEIDKKYEEIKLR